VVASEVRNLAQRAAAAAKEIKELINASVEKVDNGSRLVGQAGQTMDEIVASVKRVTDIMGGITKASQEQSAGIGEVGQAIGQMDTMTQQNAALVEQATAAAASLLDQAGVLNTSLAVFKLPALPGNSPTSMVTQVAQPHRSPPLPAVSKVAKTIPLRPASTIRLDESWKEF